MEIIDSKLIPGLKVIKPSIFYDFRGSYVNTYNDKDYSFYDLDNKKIIFKEDDVSLSSYKVLRGLHGDAKTWKLIQCLLGDIYYVVVDMRKNLKTYLNWEAFSINDKNRYQILVPAGCANGHLVMSEKCLFSYKQSELYGENKQFTVLWNDKKINIFWPIADPILSIRDISAKSL